MSFDVTIYGSQPHARRAFTAFADGLLRHGIKCQFEPNGATPDADLVVMWSHRHQHIHKLQKQRNSDYLVMERGYFADRFKYISLGFNGLNGRAEFCNDNSSCYRLDLIEADGFDMLPWEKLKGQYVLIMGQVAGDCSLSGVDINHWYSKVYQQAVETFAIPVYFRLHPKSKDRAFAQKFKTLPGTLEDALKGAFCVIPFNSNSGVDAVMAGVPAITFDAGSMAWDVSTHKIGGPLFYGDRYQWACNLAYCQWTLQEIRNGIAWDHLRQRYA